MVISATWTGAPFEWNTGDDITAERLNDEIMSRLLWIYDKMIPVGAIMPFGGEFLPASAPFLWCNGTAVSRTTYANLFAVIGTLFGSGDGSTTFNIPDTRGRVLINQGAGSGLTTRSVGDTGGEEAHVLTVAELASHQHNQIAMRSASGGSTNAIESVSTASTVALNSAGYTNYVGSDSAHNNMQPFVAITHVIRY